MIHCVETHDGIPPGLSAGQTVGMARLFCLQAHKPRCSHGNTVQFASPLQGQKESVAHIGCFNFSHVLQNNRNPEENELCSHVGWIVCSLEKELERLGFCVTSGNILEGPNSAGNVICTFLCDIQRGQHPVEDWPLQLSPKCVLGKHVKSSPEGRTFIYDW